MALFFVCLLFVVVWVGRGKVRVGGGGGGMLSDFYAERGKGGTTCSRVTSTARWCCFNRLHVVPPFPRSA